MKTLFLIWKDIKNPDVGGAEILLYELAKRLVENGHEVTWFCREFAGCPKEEIINGIKVIRRGNKLTVYLEALRYYKSSKQKPDRVIESINTIAWQTPLYVPKDKRLVLVNQLAKEVFFYELPPPLSYLAYFLEKWEYKPYKSTKFLCYSESVKKDIAGFGVPVKNISVFSLGVDHERYKISGKKKKVPFFIFVGRLARMKRVDLCIEAMKLLVERHQKARLAIIGYGPEEKNLKRMIDKYTLWENISIVNKDSLFFENNQRDMKVKLMQEAWCLLLPSVKEGWGMVATEAAACGTPSIVTDVTGLKNSVVDGETGYIISPNPTAFELSSKMFEIIEDRKLRENLSKNAVEWASNFSWEKSYQEFIKLIK